MKCQNVRLTEVCKDCHVGGENVDCPTTGNDGSTQTYTIPPSTIFNLVPYKNHVGEKVVCISDHNNNNVKVGEVYTIVDQTNESFGYVRIDKFEKYPNMWFSPSAFKKLKATYNGIEYTLRVEYIAALREKG